MLRFLANKTEWFYLQQIGHKKSLLIGKLFYDETN